jgi:MoxR-like ATPase
LLGTIGSIKFAATREYFADLRISENERATTEAIAESDKAKAESAKATLALAKLRAGRFLTPNGQRDLAQEMVRSRGCVC